MLLKTRMVAVALQVAGKITTVFQKNDVNGHFLHHVILATLRAAKLLCKRSTIFDILGTKNRRSSERVSKSAECAEEPISKDGGILTIHPAS